MSFDSSLATTVQVFQSLTSLRSEVEKAGLLILKTLKAGNKLLICGNGGSAAEAQHFCTELVGRYFKNRQSLPAIALTSDGSLLTCIGNDYGYDAVFSRQIAGLAQPGDLVVGITSSGNSRTSSPPSPRPDAADCRASPCSAGEAAACRDKPPSI
jgi:D-sedoheptulose 7-phosphate isomerase